MSVCKELSFFAPYQPMCSLFILVMLKDCMSYLFPSPDCHNLLKKRRHATFFLCQLRGIGLSAHTKKESVVLLQQLYSVWSLCLQFFLFRCYFTEWLPSVLTLDLPNRCQDKTVPLISSLPASSRGTLCTWHRMRCYHILCHSRTVILNVRRDRAVWEIWVRLWFWKLCKKKIKNHLILVEQELQRIFLSFYLLR